MKTKQPSQLHNILLTIACSLPILSIMYTQNVNHWVIFMFFTLIIGHVFNTFSIANIDKVNKELISALNIHAKAILDLTAISTNAVTINKALNNKIDLLYTENQELKNMLEESNLTLN